MCISLLLSAPIQNYPFPPFFHLFPRIFEFFFIIEKICIYIYNTYIFFVIDLFLLFVAGFELDGYSARVPDDQEGMSGCFEDTGTQRVRQVGFNQCCGSGGSRTLWPSGSGKKMDPEQNIRTLYLKGLQGYVFCKILWWWWGEWLLGKK